MKKSFLIDDWGGNKVKLILLENVWIYKTMFKVSHVNFILEDTIMGHDSGKRTSVHSRFQPYHMNPAPAPKDAFLQSVFTRCICSTCHTSYAHAYKPSD